MGTIFFTLAGIAALAFVALAGWKLYKIMSDPVKAGEFAAGFSWVVLSVIGPMIFKRKSPEEEKLDNEAYRRNEQRPTKFNRHPGEHR